MDFSRRMVTAAGLGALAAAAARPALAFDGPVTDLIEGSEDFLLALDAYVYGYPLVTMEMTRRVITNVAEPEGTRAPMGQFIKLREYPERQLPRRHRPQRRHALHHRLHRRRRRALGPRACRT